MCRPMNTCISIVLQAFFFSLLPASTFECANTCFYSTIQVHFGTFVCTHILNWFKHNCPYPSVVHSDTRTIMYTIRRTIQIGEHVQLLDTEHFYYLTNYNVITLHFIRVLICTFKYTTHTKTLSNFSQMCIISMFD